VTTATIPRLADLVKARGDAPPANLPGFWILAGTSVAEPYPCQCRYTPCRWDKCADRLRTEGDALPAGCCGRGNAPVADEWGPQPASELPGGTGVPAEPVRASTAPPGPPRVAFSCDCPTPWDPPPPLLLIAAGKDGPLRSTTPLAAKTTDPRGDADALLAGMGAQRTKPWRDGRHVLLPPAPGARGKTRPCWHAPLADGRLAVVDTPDETGSGVHCPDCHRDFANAGAWQIHRKRDGWREMCKDPASVLTIRHVEVVPAVVDLVGRVREASRIASVTTGVPLLRQGIAGVWQVDPLAAWGEQGPPFSRDEASSIWTRAQERLAGDRWRYGRGMNRDRMIK
jgi:hypothetical protein